MAFDIRPFNGQACAVGTNTHSMADERVAAFMQKIWARAATIEEQSRHTIMALTKDRKRRAIPESPAWLETRPVSEGQIKSRWRAYRETEMPEWLREQSVGQGYKRASKVYAAKNPTKSRKVRYNK